MVKIIEPDHRPATTAPTNVTPCNCSCACACTPSGETAMKSVSLSVRSDPFNSEPPQR